MPLTVAAKELMLNALAATHAQLHDGYPDHAGNNELSGATRQSITWNTTGGTLDSSNQPVWTVAGGDAWQWIGLWSAVTAGTFKGFAPLGADIKEYTVDVIANDKILSIAHGYANDQTVVFFEAINGDAAPGGFTNGTVYYVINTATDDFQLSATQGGSAVDITDQVDVAKLSKIDLESTGGGGTFTLNDMDIISL